ncbi:hypothetical protein H8S20_04240 [Clostridium sp. NSJ-6]|uniref:Phage protein n=1 Tax=Clostridium hominis TaxID=2763036 RepID=A0ABR7D9N6_9CLOT|nr:hypothetical protein [Clostridium hominis]MBC5628099.1 hypothetical protein [Clostridium hominis]MDU2673141.1 hypothetical protein [Clostridium sp.]
MKHLSENLEKIVEEFLEKNVPDETKHDFIIAAIHFNINLNVCTKYDLMRIDHKAKELADVEKNEILTNAAIYSYALFRAINHNEVSEKEVVKIKSALMNISTCITEYMTYRIDENTLNKQLYDELLELGV